MPMLTLHVDTALMAGVETPITVDTLLSLVEPTLARERRRVTTLRINGVEEPAFREADVLTRELRATDHVAIESAPAAALAQSALRDAAHWLAEVGATTGAVAAACERGATEEARQGIAAFAENLSLLALLVQMADGCAREAGIDSSPWLGGEVTALDRQIQTIQIHAAAGDWSAAGAAMATELPRVLDAWRARILTGLETLQSALASPVA